MINIDLRPPAALFSLLLLGSCALVWVYAPWWWGIVVSVFAGLPGLGLGWMAVCCEK